MAFDVHGRGKKAVALQERLSRAGEPPGWGGTLLPDPGYGFGSRCASGVLHPSFLASRSPESERTKPESHRHEKVWKNVLEFGDPEALRAQRDNRGSWANGQLTPTRERTKPESDRCIKGCENMSVSADSEDPSGAAKQAGTLGHGQLVPMGTPVYVNRPSRRP